MSSKLRNASNPHLSHFYSTCSVSMKMPFLKVLYVLFFIIFLLPGVGRNFVFTLYGARMLTVCEVHPIGMRICINYHCKAE